MLRLQAVAFDLDGLMFNSEDLYWEVGTELLRRRDLIFSRELSTAMMGRPPRSCFEVMIRWHSLDEDWKDLSIESEQIYIDRIDEMLEPMPGLFELLDALERADLPKAVCTSSTRNVVETVLERFSLEKRFQFTLAAEDVTDGKPDPEIYLNAAARFGLRPSEMVVLEDSQTGCQSAAAAKAMVAAVPGDHSRDQDFSMADVILDSLTDSRLYELLGLDGRFLSDE